ncbi:FAD-dependent oxidoreductase [uncultured Sunxiuqinia sp.]|uniref:FAD-dependent oxidoreductase n=1 Tax=uncultured Sunxiuqinia sp. TaxID=1573825 RepID=UPI002AA7C5C0|nr:FAD-dependent oxidoreductase [uncultured Sunxiuqinia sp.]
MKRRQFIGLIGNSSLVLLAGGLSACGNANKKLVSEEFVFVEAEAFENYGGWSLDQQSMEHMGSPYLLAHGLGIPVKDAETQIKLPSAGKYRVWVRTRDWVAPWQAPGAPGKFQLLLNNKVLPEIFGTKNAEWHWHNGGTVDLAEHATLALHDLTGFEGRCEAILFCKDVSFEPINDVAALRVFRRHILGFPDKPDDGGSFDLIVVGGGLAGTCAAISAARNGVKVALVQDRPVLGGNCSSEVRVGPAGLTNIAPFPHIGDIVNEILPPERDTKGKITNAAVADFYDDVRKLRVVHAESNITLLTDHRAIEVESENNVITAVTIENTRTGRQKLLKGKLFADCTGDATIGFKAGADFEYKIENLMGSSNLFSLVNASKQDEVLGCECQDKSALLSKYEKGEFEQPFPRCPWALDLSDKPFPGRKKKGEKVDANEGPEEFAHMWFWESGFNKDQIDEIELIRDHNFRAMYGAWDALKNIEKLYPNHRLGWSAYIAGKRESRRLMGDIVLDAEDFKQQRKFKDPAFPCTWHVDLHFPKKEFQKGFEGNEFIADYDKNISKDYDYGGLFWAPYRCLYSRNIKNLFMAGRDISVTKTGLGPVRVMKTCGMMGEIVGKAASVCVKFKASPREVYENYLIELQVLMS